MARLLRRLRGAELPTVDAHEQRARFSAAAQLLG
jgi:hypothetical protein